MGTETIFGGWDGAPASGEHDKVSAMWPLLAAQEGAPNFGLSQRRHEWTMLMELYLRARPRLVVEVGVAQGGTAAGWMRLGSPRGVFIFIDRDLNDSRPRPGDKTPFYDGPLKYYSRGGGIKHVAQAGQSVIGISGWTYDKEVQNQLVTALAGRKIDWLFHDASHEESMFLDDFNWMWPLVSDGGVFACHDIMPSVASGVTKDKAWRKIVEATAYSARMEFLGGTGSDSLGIGVLIK